MQKSMTFKDYWNKINKPVVESKKSAAELVEWAEKVKKADYVSYTNIDDIKTS